VGWNKGGVSAMAVAGGKPLPPATFKAFLRLFRITL